MWIHSQNPVCGRMQARDPMRDAGPRSQAIAVGNSSGVLSDRKGVCGARPTGSMATATAAVTCLVTTTTSMAAVWVPTTSSPGQSSPAWWAGYPTAMWTSTARGDKTEFDARYIGLYSSAAWDRWYVDGVAIYADLEHDTERFVDLLDERLTGSLMGTNWPPMWRQVGPGNWLAACNCNLWRLCSTRT